MNWKEILEESIFKNFTQIDRCKTIYLKAGDSMNPTEDIIYLLRGDIDFSYTNFFGDVLSLPSGGRSKFLSVTYKPQLKRCLITALEDSCLLLIPEEVRDDLENNLKILKEMYRDVVGNQLFFLESYKENFVRSNLGNLEKIAYFLLESGGNQGRFDPSKKKELLARLDIKSNLLYRTLDQLADKGVIQIRGGSVEIKDIKYLEGLLKKK
ncbi:hypothetical protein PM10SUCC1_25850 [Propionigenium maris DSM 9537]|uniref:cAMP-binding domain of CRP or a regulatory subunit of cAMP-dependent protein kinases n=1 Tax=Propionigenium maris DSM 9537 TaxID=1123000 RepID=A0A9W6GNL6_9FUSO|nr:hypothetical protein [Propionigenium maris]GLI57071.1 hypothetical protein PM10SUCC1_25850 [Propionigenium maris DSM 9537]